jgi:hypothetical protein
VNVGFFAARALPCWRPTAWIASLSLVWFRREAGTSGWPHHSSITQGRTGGFPGASRFATSAPELGMVDVFARVQTTVGRDAPRAIEPRNRFERVHHR